MGGSALHELGEAHGAFLVHQVLGEPEPVAIKDTIAQKTQMQTGTIWLLACPH